MASPRLTLALACAAALCATCHGYAGGVAAAPRRAVAVMAAKEVPAYTADGASTGTVSVELRQSAKPMYVVHRKVITELANRRQGTASTKTRSEVSGGGRKPYKQKGTGRARRGSTRSPLIVGGGVIHGPKPKDWSLKMNKKERRVATASAIMGVLSRAIVVDGVETQFTRAKTADMVALLRRLPLEQDQPNPPKVVMITKDKSENLELSGRNVGNLVMLTMSTINVHDILGAGKVVITKAALEVMQERYAPAVAA